MFLGFGVAARSFLLCWSMQHVERTDPERYIFGPYFLVPFLLAVAVLLLEMGLVSRSRATLRAALAVPSGLVVLAAVGDRPDDLYRGFLALFIARLGGTPLYLTLLAAAGFYAYAALRRVPLAVEALTAALAALAVVGPGTLDLHGLVAPTDPGRSWRSPRCNWGSGCARRECVAVPGRGGMPGRRDDDRGADLPHRGPIAFHLALAVVLVLGAAFDDALGRLLRTRARRWRCWPAWSCCSGRFDRAGLRPLLGAHGLPADDGRGPRGLRAAAPPPPLAGRRRARAWRLAGRGRLAGLLHAAAGRSSGSTSSPRASSCSPWPS